MKKKKIVVSTVIAICLIVSAGLGIFLGIKNYKKNSNNVDMSVAFKKIAMSTWSRIGVAGIAQTNSDVLKTSFYDVPEKAESPEDSATSLQLKMTTNSVASLLYFVGCLFDNSSFSLANGVAKFSVKVDVEGVENQYSFTISPKVSPSKNELSLNLYYEVDSRVYYYVFEADYNFKTNTLNSARIFGKESTMYVEIQIPESGELLIYTTYNSGDTLTSAIEMDMNYFLESAKYVKFSDISFVSEIQLALKMKNDVLALLSND